MGFLFFLFIIFLFVVLLVVSLGFSFLRGVFSLFGSRRNNSADRPEEEVRSNETERKTTGRNHAKIIKDDEGEYVDYEEVK